MNESSVDGGIGLGCAGLKAFQIFEVSWMDCYSGSIEFGVPGRASTESQDGMAMGEEVEDDGGADKSSGASDKDVHSGESGDRMIYASVCHVLEQAIDRAGG